VPHDTISQSFNYFQNLLTVTDFSALAWLLVPNGFTLSILTTGRIHLSKYALSMHSVFGQASQKFACVHTDSLVCGHMLLINELKQAMLSETQLLQSEQNNDL
jgi:hypothetical protein